MEAVINLTRLEYLRTVRNNRLGLGLNPDMGQPTPALSCEIAPEHMGRMCVLPHPMGRMGKSRLLV